MSILLGPCDIGYTPSNQDMQRVRKLSRRRTVSTSFEQASHDRILQDDVGKKSKSYAYEMEELPRLDLKKTALMNSFLMKKKVFLLVLTMLHLTLQGQRSKKTLTLAMRLELAATSETK